MYSKKEFKKLQNKSNSRENIQLISEEGKFFVQKSWDNIGRGVKAIRKQIDFDDISISNLIIKSPKVFKTEIIDEKIFEAKMEYIEGYSGSDIALIGTREVSMNLKESLSMLINKNFEHSKIQSIDINLFIQKIEEIKKNIIDDIDLELKINQLKNEFLKDSFLDIPCGVCHGDLTLSNIIVSRTGALNLIDFLPTFVESPLWDIAKIFQDLKYGWSYRDLKGPERASAKIFFLNCLPSQIFMYEKVFNRQLLLFDSLNLARLSPYIKNNKTRNWIINALDISLSKL